MRRHLTDLFATAFATLVLLASGTSFACPPPPQPSAGESQVDYHRRLAAIEFGRIARHRARLLDQQRKEWITADRVLIAKVVKVRPKPAKRNDYWPGLSIVTLRPVTSLKGIHKAGRFDLYHAGATDCGPYGGGDAPQGKVGDLFVVYLNRGSPSPKSLANSYAVNNVEDPAIKTALEAINE